MANENDLHRSLAAMPVRPWPCARCRHMVHVRKAPPGAPDSHNIYRCGWVMPKCPARLEPRHTGDMTHKRLFGPHEGEPVTCDLFAAA